jgi:HlyD family secretion protein
MSEHAQEVRHAVRRLNRAAVLTVLLFMVGFGGWAANAMLSGAVIAPGLIVVESNVKRVQHPTGGVVGQILVREGAAVAEGDVVVRLDDTQIRANLGIVQVQIDELSAREARLLAERDGAKEIDFPVTLTERAADPVIARTLAGEQGLIEARRTSREGQKAQLRERIAQLAQEIEGLSAQLAAKTGEDRLITQELAGVAKLFEQNLVSVQRLMALRRDQTRIQGERGHYVAELARARGRISEIEMQILQLDQDHRTEVLRELREVQGHLGELRERRVAAEDQLRRIDIRAPQSGVVHHLTTHTVGGVVGARETLMEIVPQADALVLEVRVAPRDIDQVAVGLSATVKILAGNQRTLPDIDGVVARVGADLTREPQGTQAYYVVRVALPEEQVARLGGLRLVPGMPTEVFIRTGERTVLEYLLKPLREQIARAFRER